MPVSVASAPATFARPRRPLVAAYDVIVSRRPWAARSGLPRRACTDSPAGSHGARATTPTTVGPAATCTAVRPPIEWPRSTTGTSPTAPRTSSSAQRASSTLPAPPSQPRVRWRRSQVLTPASWSSGDRALQCGHPPPRRAAAVDRMARLLLAAVEQQHHGAGRRRVETREGGLGHRCGSVRPTDPDCRSRQLRSGG